MPRVPKNTRKKIKRSEISEQGGVGIGGAVLCFAGFYLLFVAVFLVWREAYGWAESQRWFDLQEIEVSGIQHATRSEVISYSKLKLGVSIFDVDVEKSARRIEELPWIKKAVNLLSGRGSDIWIHICGKTDQFLHLLKDVNFQGFEVDAKVPMPLARELLGDKIALKGNLDTTFLLQKTPDEVYEATLEILRTGGFKTGIIMSPGCGVPKNTSLENLQAMQRACRDFQI